MAIERLTGVDQANLLIERTLGNKETLHALIIEGKNGNKNAILQPLALEVAKLEPVTQACFLRTLIEDMAIEGDNGVTDRRDGALEILSAEAMRPLVQTNMPALVDTYLEAVRGQGRQNDPFIGSIDTLLEAGQVLAPYFPQKPERREQITEAWTQVIDQFHTLGTRFHIRLKLDEIRERMSPHWLFDEQVAVLRKQGLTYPDIAKQLGSTPRVINGSRRRLIDDGRIEAAPTGRPISQATIELDAQVELLIKQRHSTTEIQKLLGGRSRTIRHSLYRVIDAKVAQLRKQGLTNPQIAEQLGMKKTVIEDSIRRFLDTRVEQLRKQGFTYRQIAERLDSTPRTIKDSIQRLIAAGIIEPGKPGRKPKLPKS